MKKLLLVVCLPALFFWSCDNGGGEGDDSGNRKQGIPQEIKGYIPFNLGEWGLDVVLYIPDSTVGLPDIRVNNAGETEIRVGDYYQVAIAIGGDLELKKADLREDLLFKCSILQEDSTSILYNAKLPDGSKTFYHFYAIVNANGTDYELHDIETGDIMPEKAVSRMLAAAKFLQAKEKQMNGSAGKEL